MVPLAQGPSIWTTTFDYVIEFLDMSAPARM